METGASSDTPAGGNKDRLKVFVSYSRKDVEFADQLVAALNAFGFSPEIDRTGIYGAENWEESLGGLIQRADVVVFVLTPASAVSDVCEWEVDQAVAQGKRIVPVAALPLGDAKPHKEIRNRNWVYFYPDPSVPGAGFGTGLSRLIEALRVNVEWTRKHTILGEAASRWEAANRSLDMLLQGSELRGFKTWRDERPADAQEITTLQREFIQTSEDVEVAQADTRRRELEEREEALKEAARAQEEKRKILQRMLAVVVPLAVFTFLAAAFIYKQNRQLEGNRLRLQEGMKLKIADTQYAVIATEKWYRIATDYKLAIGVYHRDGQPRANGTGFLVKGESLHADWAGQIVFLTASHVIRKAEENPGRDLSRDYILFPAVDREARVRIGGILFFSEFKNLDFAVLRLAGELPRHVVPVDLEGQVVSRDALGGVAVLQWNYKIDFLLGLGHGLARPDNLQGVPDERMFYTHVTDSGASGSPVFDANSGKVVCLHAGGNRYVRPAFGYCTSMAKIIRTVAAKPAAGTS